ncbi:hypothetical protein HDA32_001893 [Spinactinospora alkalitolerans]|uniref:Probable membrane transporter protein n=1 Tax=Spinactinospora alkalitolerans TaxID=687207 RepID=A0A852TVC8_9ACTN|nr:sulfite exporter TauE/SafE family protein [Spinactinospora alkalitolerans]NYE46773.1 hypothetical protein [Spinactinospora alkalitolerans]
MPDFLFLIAAGTAVLLGAMVQGGVGLGLGLVAAPVISLLDPGLMPGSMLITTAVLPMLTLGSEWRHTDWRGIGWGMGGRLFGTAAGVWIVAALDPRMLGGAVGAMVLAAVVLSLWDLRMRITPWTLTAAGLVSGVTGTATSIGGPPMALLYQHEPGPRVRATLAGYFIIGVSVSLVALGLGGQLPARQVWIGAALIPFVVAGFLLGRPLRRVVDAGKMRIALLAVVTVSGVVLLLQSLL